MRRKHESAHPDTRARRADAAASTATSSPSHVTDMEALSCFVQVADAGGFAAAARRLNIDPSIVSRRVARLEGALGVRLLSRTTRRVSLTEAGQVYVERVREALELLDVAAQDAVEQVRTPQGTLRISAPQSFGHRVIAPFASRFLAAHPRIRLELRLSDRLVDLVAEGIDLAIRMGPPRDSSMLVRRLADSRKVLAASPRYLKRNPAPQHPDELARHACIGFSGHADWPFWRLSNDQRTLGVRPQGPLVTDSFELQLQCALDGTGICFTPEWLAAEYLRKGDLVRVLPDWHGHAQDAIHALMPPGRLVPAKTRAFLEALEQAMSPRRAGQRR